MNRTVSNVIENAANDLDAPQIDGLYQAVELQRCRRDRRWRAPTERCLRMRVRAGLVSLILDE